MQLLETKGLAKSYDGRTVVNGVDITVKRGELLVCLVLMARERLQLSI